MVTVDSHHSLDARVRLDLLSMSPLDQPMARHAYIFEVLTVHTVNLKGTDAALTPALTLASVRDTCTARQEIDATLVASVGMISSSMDSMSCCVAQWLREALLVTNTSGGSYIVLFDHASSSSCNCHVHSKSLVSPGGRGHLQKYYGMAGK